MEQATATATPAKEYIAWPTIIEFGGLSWVRSDREDNTGVEYFADGENKTRLRAYRYPEAPERWLWNAEFKGIEPNRSLAHEYAIGIIVYDMEEAMTCAVNAFDDWLDDMQRILRQQRPGDRYALGFGDGQAALKAKIEQVERLPGDVDITYADVSKAKRLLDWEPKVPIEEGMRKFVEWCREELWISQ